jgi:hypothetical protein
VKEMGYLEKKFILHERGAQGQLLPVDYDCEILGGTISIVPATRGEILETIQKARSMGIDDNKHRAVWEEFVIQHLEIPKLTKEDFLNMKLIPKPEDPKKHIDIIDVLMDAINAVSGIDTPEKGEEELKK